MERNLGIAAATAAGLSVAYLLAGLNTETDYTLLVIVGLGLGALVTARLRNHSA